MRDGEADASAQRSIDEVLAQAAAAPGRGTPIVLLQGPVGGFLGAFARHAESTHGIGVLKVQFNLGDVVCDRCHWHVSYTGAMDRLGDWYARLFEGLRPRAVIMLGDQRPVHRPAHAVCKALGIPVFVFEEGYIRPDFVTLERDGNNANSPLRDTPVPAEMKLRDITPARRYGSNVPIGVLRTAVYFVAMWSGRPMFRLYRHHRSRTLVHEVVSWVSSFARNRWSRRREITASVDLARTRPHTYFVLALQVYDDLQLTSHGRGWTTETLIERTLTSFAQHAPQGTWLAIKQHPFDVGHRNYKPLVMSLARRLGVADRVFYVRYANLHLMLENGLGLVTVNSTSGIAALELGCPVLTLGNCFYARDGLATDGARPEALDAFWKAPPRIDRELAARFRQHIADSALINGDFYIGKSWKSLFDKALDRILADSVAKSQTPQDLSITRAAE